ncbi:2-dehydropantoate 2-reductase [Streptococcus henryi]|uniref:2-dehydropantoate 2-reductase n=1 Tax=Streptococcus henryi TaxID=439219 RepID=A0A1G6BIW8_9STRE|nr:2-dehydropantoate 2-reductase N-terminal domain-containing protein [Streptococcus henryi]SDB20527.1 2-dehydropantoate 2-reductase [Streptococcus henryi]
MRIGILGLGVIGTTYGYTFQKVGHQVEHIVREDKRTPQTLKVKLLDGRYSSKGENKSDFYQVSLSHDKTDYDFIILSVRSGKLKSAIETLKEKQIKGTIIFFCNFWDSREEIHELAEGYNYILAFPTAGGRMRDDTLEAVIFDHLMLEDRMKTNAPNYDDFRKLLSSADVKWEIPHDMIEWIWIHMAINAGVTSTAARMGNLANPEQLALHLMNSSKELTIAVKTIRDTLKVVEARGVNLNHYRSELLPYKIPAWIAGKAMKYMFAKNELTRKIMTLHNDKNDILYCCESVYQTAKDLRVSIPRFQSNMQNIENG